MAEQLTALRNIGASDQAEKLEDRLPAAGLFSESPKATSRFGLECNGAFAEPWGWDDL